MIAMFDTEAAQGDSNDPNVRIARALEIAVTCKGYDGARHKDWVIDQMVRALTGCPMVQATARGSNNLPYTYEKQGESPEYVKLVADVKAGEDGPDTYSWDVGVVP